MSGSTENTVWARTLVDELARAGLKEVVVAPGSRSTPLVMACAADERLRVRVHLDERSCGFFALGVGKATGRPAAVVTTSGTAVANLYPAVIEASQSGVPLLVLSADRPTRLRGSDANQAIDQVHIFGRYPRAFFEMAEASLDERSLQHLRAVAARAWDAATGFDGGPVHLNIPFDKPLEPAELGAGVDPAALGVLAGRPDGDREVDTQLPRPTASDAQLDEVLSALHGRAGVIVAGPTEEARRLGPAVRRLAEASGFALLADPLSGARFGFEDAALAVSGYDLFLRDPDVRDRLVPDVVLRVGASPTSAAVQRWLFQHRDVPQIVIDDGPRWKDHGGTASTYLKADAADALSRLWGRWSRDETAPMRSTPWRQAHEAADAVLSGLTPAASEEPGVAAAVIRALPAGASLFVSSSMPIRDLDAFARPGDGSAVSVFASRGASGIDGIVSSAFGMASQNSGGSALVIGDVAFFHDQNGLLWSRETDAPLVIVLVDNDGGAIFGMLPIAEYEPAFTRYFTTPHGIDPSHAAAAHGVACVRAVPGEVERLVSEALERGGTTLLHVRTDGPSGHRARAATCDAVVRRVREAME